MSEENKELLENLALIIAIIAGAGQIAEQAHRIVKKLRKRKPPK